MNDWKSENHANYSDGPMREHDFSLDVGWEGWRMGGREGRVGSCVGRRVGVIVMLICVRLELINGIGIVIVIKLWSQLVAVAGALYIGMSNQNGMENTFDNRT